MAEVKPLREFIALFEEIWHLVDKVDSRCESVDGPIPATHEEIAPHEVKQLLEKLACMASFRPKLYDGRKGKIIAELEQTIDVLETKRKMLEETIDGLNARQQVLEKEARRLQDELDDEYYPANKRKTGPRDTYRLVYEGSAEELAAAVGQAIREGYRPLGGVTVSCKTTIDQVHTVWAQAMTKRA